MAAGYLDPEQDPRAQHLVDLVIKECYIAIENTNTHHVHTTFDQGLVQATIVNAKKAVAEHFGAARDSV